jgi:hypothetical protein
VTKTALAGLESRIATHEPEPDAVTVKTTVKSDGGLVQ